MSDENSNIVQTDKDCVKIGGEKLREEEEE